MKYYEKFNKTEFHSNYNMFKWDQDENLTNKYSHDHRDPPRERLSLCLDLPLRYLLLCGEPFTVHEAGIK